MKAEQNTMKTGVAAGLMAALLFAAPVKAQEAASAPTAEQQIDQQPQDVVADEQATPAAEVPTGPLATEAEESIATYRASLEDNTALLAIANAKRHVHDASLTPDMLQTLFYTAWQHALLDEAKEGFMTGRPTQLADGTTVAARPRPEPGLREISLGGIAYTGFGRWTIWLNGVRITPGALPDSVMDIKVTSGYVDLKWYDAYTSKIYPIRLRPQERFNLDSRIFLPGTGAM